MVLKEISRLKLLRDLLAWVDTALFQMMDRFEREEAHRISTIYA